MNILYLNNTQNMRFYIDGPLNLQITKKLRKFVFQKKFKKKIHPQPNKKKNLWPVRPYSKTKYEVF